MVVEDMKTLDQKQRSLLHVTIAVTKVSAFACAGSLTPTPSRATWWGPGTTHTCSSLHYRRRTLKFRNPNLFWYKINMTVYYSRGIHYFYLSRLKTTLLLALKRNMISIFQWCSLYKYLWKDSSEKGNQYLCSQDMQTWKIYKELSLNTIL